MDEETFRLSRILQDLEVWAAQVDLTQIEREHYADILEDLQELIVARIAHLRLTK